jgi:hypothetical protein
MPGSVALLPRRCCQARWALVSSQVGWAPPCYPAFCRLRCHKHRLLLSSGVKRSKAAAPTCLPLLLHPGSLSQLLELIVPSQPTPQVFSPATAWRTQKE